MFFTVTVRAVLVVFTRCAGKVTEAGVNSRRGLTPAPERGTGTGGKPVSLVVRVREAEAALSTVGLNVTFSTSLVPGSKSNAAFGETVKGWPAVMDSAVMRMGPVPLLLTVTC
jgi:hypothetical protein